MAILSRYKLEKYQYGIDVQKLRQLYGLSGKIIYNGRWLSGRTDRIIIVEMDETITEREAQFYLEVNSHKNIIRTLGSIQNTSNLTIFIQEFAAEGDLADMLMDNQFNITQPILIEMFAQVADAMSYVASKNIVHGDLGCRNVLVFRVDPFEPKNNLVKITDFGLARWIDRAPSGDNSSIIPIRYCAPEILEYNRHSNYSEKSDVYSMGVLIWEALSNSEIPYSSAAQDEVVKEMKLKNERLPKPSVCDDHLWILMNDCWTEDPEERPIFQQIKSRLSNMEVSEVSIDRLYVPFYELQNDYAYQLDVDVKINDLQHDTFGKNIYEAEWLLRRGQPVVLVEKKEKLSECETLCYTTFHNHKHIVHTLGFVKNDRQSIMILQERALHGSLQTLLQTGRFKPSEEVLVEIFSQILDALIVINEQGLVHGDVRCANVLVSEMHSSDPKKNLVKLTNFSLVHRNDPTFIDDRRLVISVRHCATEILRSAGRTNYSEMSDVYSMGVLMWEAWSNGKPPYESSVTNSKVRRRKLNDEKLPKPLVCNDQIWSIMEDCWLNEPTIRYNLKQIKIRLSHIDIKPIKTYLYELNVNVKQKHPLNSVRGNFYKAEWIPKKEPKVILIVMNEETAEREASFYMQFSSHPHIIHTFGFVKNDLQLIMLLQERATHGDLQTLLQKGQFQSSPKVFVGMFLQIVDAMIYITNQGIVHGDLRCANVLVFQMDSSEPTKSLVKLTSFSLARSKDQSVTATRLPDSRVRYCAPEILRNADGTNYSEVSDVYSMGVLMWEACSKGEIPYGDHMSDHDIRERKLKDPNLPRLTGCPDQLWQVIEGCWRSQPELRFNFKETAIQLRKIRFEFRASVTSESDHREGRILIDVVDPRRPSTLKRDRSGEPTKSITDLSRLTNSNKRHLADTINYDRKISFSRKEKVIIPPKESIRYPSCIYCGEEYPDRMIGDHQRSHCPSRPRPPVIKKPPHRFSSLNYDERSWLNPTDDSLEKPRSIWDRICLCFRSNN